MVKKFLRELAFAVYRHLERYMFKSGLILAFSKPDPPPPPDYAAAATAQGQANIDAAIAAGRINNPDIYTPLGSQTVSWSDPYAGYAAPTLSPSAPTAPAPTAPTATNPYQPHESDYWNWQAPTAQAPTSGAAPATGATASGVNPYALSRPTITQSLTPEGQALFDTQMGLSKQYGDLATQAFGRVGDAFGQGFDTSSLPEISDGTMARDQVTQAMLEQLQPFMDRQRDQTQNNLLIQGHNRGGNAWDATQMDLGRQENDARLAAILAGGQEQSRLYGMESANRARALQEQSFLRNLPLSEINALRTGSQPGMPQFQQYQGQGVAAAPIFDATQAGYNAQLGAYNADAAQSAGTMGGLFDLGGAALQGAGAAGGFGSLFAFSDRRLKRDIHRVGSLWDLPVYIFRYLWSDDWNLGFMADEVEALYPERVREVMGFKVVNYGR